MTQQSQLLLVTPPVFSVSHSTHVYNLFNVTVILLYTGIDDLLGVKMTLKTVIDWQSLGLALGLLYPTLKKIEKEHRGVIEMCKMEMLAAWLQRQDCVTLNGVPSWLTLKTALINIGENELADAIIT